MILKLKGCIFWLKVMIYLRNVMIFGIKSAIVCKNNLLADPSVTKHFWN